MRSVLGVVLAAAMTSGCAAEPAESTQASSDAVKPDLRQRYYDISFYVENRPACAGADCDHRIRLTLRNTYNEVLDEECAAVPATLDPHWDGLVGVIMKLSTRPLLDHLPGFGDAASLEATVEKGQFVAPDHYTQAPGFDECGQVKAVAGSKPKVVAKTRIPFDHDRNAYGIDIAFDTVQYASDATFDFATGMLRAEPVRKPR